MPASLGNWIEFYPYNWEIKEDNKIGNRADCSSICALIVRHPSATPEQVVDAQALLDAITDAMAALTYPT